MVVMMIFVTLFCYYISAQHKGCHVYVGQVFQNWHLQYTVEFYSPLYVAALEEGDEHLLEDMNKVAAKGWKINLVMVQGNKNVVGTLRNG